MRLNSDKLIVKFGIRLIQILDVVREANKESRIIFLKIFTLIKIKDEKNQILTTNVWLKHVNLKFNLII